MVRDYKFNTWTIEGKNKKLIPGIKKIILKSAKLVDRYLEGQFKEQAEIEDYYLNNKIGKKNYDTYLFASEKIKDLIKEIKENNKKKEENRTKKIKDPLVLLGSYDKEGRCLEEISHYNFLLTISFFSFTESIFDLFFSFQRPLKLLKYFRGSLDWKERFKKVINISLDRDIGRIYKDIEDIHRSYRNVLIHDSNNERKWLFKLSGIGLVPFSYSNIFSLKFGSEIEQSLFFMGKFNKFLIYLNRTMPYKCYMLYWKYNFPVPINKEDANLVAKEMGDYRKFKRYLEEEMETIDRFNNREG